MGLLDDSIAFLVSCLLFLLSVLPPLLGLQILIENDGPDLRIVLLFLQRLCILEVEY
jgi:hypothetical protein